MEDGALRHRVRRFLGRLLTGTITTIILATLTLFGLQEAKDYFQAPVQTGVLAEERHGDLATLTARLAATCARAQGTAQLDTPTARCVEQAAKIVRQLWPAPSSVAGRVVAALSTGAANWMQRALSRLVPAFPGKTRHAFGV